MKRTSQRATIVAYVALAFGLAGCDAEQQPTAPQVDLARSLSSQDRARDRPAVVIDLPAEPRALDTDDDALIEAIRDAGGRVFVAFKEPGDPPVGETAFIGLDSKRHGELGALSAETASRGQRFLEAQGVTITSVYETFGMVAAVIDPNSAPELRRHPLISFVEPIGVATTKVATTKEVAAGSRGPALLGQTIPANILKVRANLAWPLPLVTMLTL